MPLVDHDDDDGSISPELRDNVIAFVCKFEAPVVSALCTYHVFLHDSVIEYASSGGSRWKARV